AQALVERAGLIAERVQVGVPAPALGRGSLDGEQESPAEALPPLIFGHPNVVNVEPVPVGAAVGATDDTPRRVPAEHGQRLEAARSREGQRVGAEAGFENGEVFPEGSRLYRQAWFVHRLFLLSRRAGRSAGGSRRVDRARGGEGGQFDSADLPLDSPPGPP